MARRRAQTTQSRWSGSSRRLAIVGIAAFLAIDGVLIYAALTASHDNRSSTEYIVPSQQPQPSITPTPTVPPVVALPVRRVLAGAGESAVWRAESGSCSVGTAPVVQTSRDGGATFTTRDLSRYDVRQVLALWVRDVNYGEAVVRIGDDCHLEGIRSFTSGQFWETSGDILPDNSFLDIDNPGTVVINGEGLPAPCADAVQAVEETERVLALCGDGSVFAWADGAWTPQAAQPGAVALVKDDATPELVFSGPDDCLLAVGVRADNGDLAPRTCAATPATPGTTVATSVEGRTWVWSGDYFASLPAG